MSLLAGARLGPYEITAAMGAGGMGEVYRARDTRLGRSVAIKVLPPQFGSDPRFRQRFEREARTVSQLTHPNICTLHDVGEAPGETPHALATHFLVMEYLEGETLAARLARTGLVSFHERPERLWFAFQAPFDGRGVIHPSTLNRRHVCGLFTAPNRRQRPSAFAKAPTDKTVDTLRVSVA